MERFPRLLLSWKCTASPIIHIPYQRGTFIKTDEPILRNQNHPKSIIYIIVLSGCCVGFSAGSACKESFCNARDMGSIPGLGRSPGEGKGYPLQYYGLENSMDCIGLQRVGHDWVTFTHSGCCTFYRFVIHLSKPIECTTARVSESHSVMSNSLQPYTVHGILLAIIL